MLFVRERRIRSVDTVFSYARFMFLGYGVLLVGFASLWTDAPRATIQWWIEGCVLAVFSGSLLLLQVRPFVFSRWLLTGLIPHAVLALWQTWAQDVAAHTWLGIAAQQPSWPGVSVFEVAGRRVLRAYGGFPHPNVLGAWMGVAFVLAYRTSMRALGRWVPIGTYGLASLFLAALVTSYSRAAWIATGVAFIAMATSLFLRAPRVERRKVVVGWIGLVLIVIGIGWVMHRGITARVVYTQVNTEQRSFRERERALRFGEELFARHRLVGVGPGGTAMAFSREGMYPSQTKYPVPPHFVPLLILDEIGLVGLMGFLFFATYLFAWAYRLIVEDRVDVVALFSRIGPWTMVVLIGFFDHYPWTLWSGHALVAITLTFLFLPIKVRQALV